MTSDYKSLGCGYLGSRVAEAEPRHGHGATRHGLRGERGACLLAGAGGRRRVQRAAIDRWAGRGAEARGAGRGPAAVSPPRGRVRAVVACLVVRRAGVSVRAPGGGGEPRAARPRADAAAARSRSVPELPPAPLPHPVRRRARSLTAKFAAVSTPPAPRLRPVFLWARQQDGTVQEVHCEDYDSRNRIRIARTPNGWRVIPRTEIYNSIRIPPAPPRERPERRRRRRSGRSRRRRRSSAAVARTSSTWLAPDLESHIPSHTIAVARPSRPSPPRSTTPDIAPSPASPSPPSPSHLSPKPPSLAEPTPLDNLLAVAELEFNQQRGEEALELELQAGGGDSEAAGQYNFLPAEEVARDVMSFELGEPKGTNDMYFERKSHAPECAGESVFQNDITGHKDLFDTISEAHYLPELGGPHDEALLESLVEKGCEDNQILGQSLDKFAHMVHASTDYVEEEDDMLLGSAPVADIINRLEQSLESPSRSSITAAQGLLHLHHIGDHLKQQDRHQQNVEQTYMSDEVFVPDPSADCTLTTLESASELREANVVNHLEYDQCAEKRLQSDVDTSQVMYTELVPDLHETYQDKTVKDHTPSLADLCQVAEQCENIIEDMNVSTNENLVSQTSEDHNTSILENDISIPKDVPTLENFAKDVTNTRKSDELGPTDLSIKHVDECLPPVVASAETTNPVEDGLSEKSDDQPKDLSVHRRLPTPHASPRRIDIPRAPSRESDAMQSPQPSGIPAVPSSPEIFTMPVTKSKHTLFLETLLSSPSPKMYTSEVTITKQQCEPLNLGKHRKSASPTVTSCSDEMRKLNKEYGEPQEKRIKRESTEDIAKISKVFSKCGDDIDKAKKSERPVHKSSDETCPIKQLHVLKTSPDFNIPDPLLVPKDKLNDILAAPGREIPALLIQRPELRLPEAFAFPAILQDPDILVISLSQLENILENDAKKSISPKPKETKSKTSSSNEPSTPQPDQTNHPKPIPSMDALAGDIDAATSAALNQMLWLPYLSQLEAMAACSQNMDFLKALNSSGYTGPNYPDLSQMFNPSARFMGPTGFPMVPPMDYDSRLQFAMWQEAMNQANAAASQRSKANTMDAQMKELASKASDVQNPYVHSTKNHQSKQHSSARTSPIAHNYNTNQRSMAHQAFLQGMYPGMNPNMRQNMPLPNLQIPYFNPNLMGSQRSPRTGQQKSPTSPYFQNNNYLQSVKQSESAGHQRSSSTSSQDSPRPRISVKSLQNLMEPNTAAGSVGSSMRRTPNPPAAMGRRREEPEVGSTTPIGEPPVMPPHPHDPSSFHLWHPLFGNQKSYNSPWSWTTVTATGD